MGDITSIYFKSLGIKHSLLLASQTSSVSSSQDESKVKQEESQTDAGAIMTLQENTDPAGYIMYQPQSYDHDPSSSLDPPPFVDPLTPPQSEHPSSMPFSVPTMSISPQVTSSLVVQLPPLSSLDSIEYVIRMHVFLNWKNFRARVATILDIVRKANAAREIFFGSASSRARLPPLMRNVSSTDRMSTASDPPPTLSLYASAAAAFALSGLVLNSSPGEYSQGDVDRKAFLTGIDLYSRRIPPTSQSTLVTLEGKETTPSQLLRLSEHALRMFENAGMVYDLDYLGACILQVLCGLYGGTTTGDGKKGKLPGGVFANVRRSLNILDFIAHVDWAGKMGKIVNIARMMGLAIDPDEFPGKYSLWEREIRRRVWWDVYYYDL
jgi:hypothetical protein